MASTSFQERRSMTDYEMLMVVLTIIGLVLISNIDHKNNHPTLTG
ncbi:hypothetical protein MXE81_12570 [Mammaliicoccus sciuri]|nr:hypothetical protein [Mammaliicoccus sciuri]MCO4324322.1 hypothetical protein [Mammaliicoccus sciuri]MEB6059145.1 hypothetical protein [Mammaliicoccus sciuri]MEB6232768.1 hypothetical protein [Mammaliicoccus sciuri]MEB7769552.1 hypothetical protein [Mammaliicoccus sciuri]MEB7819659.1 hypothetical protein [Mammaliicoccus sciuri]